VCFVLAAAQPAQSAPAAPQPRPNILWISAEDLSPDLHCYGDEYSVTPNLDKLASQGVRFTRAFSSAPVCSPSRASIITGMYSPSAGLHNHRSDVIPPAYARCFTEYLRAAGYFCTNNAKTDYNFPPPTTAWDENGQKAHWRHRENDQPFFAVFNLNETHESRNFKPYGQLTSALSASERHDPAKGKLPAYYPDTPQVRESWARWYDCITVMDQRAGELLAELEKDGLAENTIVFFWGDHGRGLPRGKRWLYDSGLRVPLIIRSPGKIDAGSVREDLVSLLDLGPTLLSVAGIEPPQYMQGRAILGEHQKPAPPLLFATRDRMDETYDMMRSVRDQRYRYIYNFQPSKPYAQHVTFMDRSPIMQEWRRLAKANELKDAPALFMAKTKPVEELYDLQTDPDEVRNLAAEPAHQERVAAMRAAMIEWMTKIDDKGVIPEAVGTPTTQASNNRPRVSPPIATVKDGKVQLTCATPGASITYKSQRRWRLYVEPLEAKGEAMTAKACRAGFQDSEEIRVGE
jgi:N-sulfoglucosamine sulfohydrolase